MNGNKLMKAVGQVDDRILERYMEAEDSLPVKAAHRNIWRRWGAVAACMLLAGGLYTVIPWGSRDIDPVIPPGETESTQPSTGVPTEPTDAPWVPEGAVWTPVIADGTETILLNADTAAALFDATKTDSAGTNQYTTVYAPSLDMLGLIPLPDAQYLPIYRVGDTHADADDLRAFMDDRLTAITSLLGIAPTEPAIEENSSYKPLRYQATLQENDTALSFIAEGNLIYTTYINYTSDARMQLNGEYLSILAADSDEQIREKLNSAMADLSAYFGIDCTDMKIVRRYSYDDLYSVFVHLYAPESSVFPENFANAPMSSQYITLKFYTDQGEQSIYHWGGSKEEAFLTSITVAEAAQDWASYYSLHGKAAMLSLEDAQAMLAKGYVFGGHSCELCMAAQPEVDFTDYDAVSLEYVTGEDGLTVPFYTFYKDNSAQWWGAPAWAKTYVCAVELEGLEEYFNLQKAEHK